MNIVISFSGGRTSAFMAKTMLESDKFKNDKIICVFANSGKEREETLLFCKQCDEAFKMNLVWVEPVVTHERNVGTTFKVVNYETANRDGKPFEEVIKKYGIPNKMFPHCTRELKTRPINAYAKSVFGLRYLTALGIRHDEIRRAKVGSTEFIYPLVDLMVTVKQVRDFWNSQPFDLQLKDYEGNCDLCWKKSLRKQLTLISENPSMPDWWHQMELKYANADLHQKGAIANFHRGNRSTVELVEMAKSSFVPVTDPFWRQQFNKEMDDEQSCACGNSQDTSEAED